MAAQTMQIQELLKGYIVDRDNIQSVGNMTVIPIISDVEFTNVADTNEVTLKSDPQYDRLEFKNAGGHIGIAMQGWMIIDRNQHAQDRTIPYAHLIKAANSKLLPANCVQAHQPGHFDVGKLDQKSFMVLPPSLRGIALKLASYTSSSTGALWDTLRTWTKGVNCHSNGLQMFYSKFEDKLEQFVAQFEPVEKQLGAIVLINGVVVAIDILPKYENWKSCWRALIRDSYGAEAVRTIENDGSVNICTSLDTEVSSIEELEVNYNKMKNQFYDEVQDIIGQSIQLSVGLQSLEQINELAMLKIENEQFTGQGVVHGDSHFIYLSLVSTTGKRVKSTKFKSLRSEPYSKTTFSFR